MILIIIKMYDSIYDFETVAAPCLAMRIGTSMYGICLSKAVSINDFIKNVSLKLFVICYELCFYY